ncbi:MAG: alpha-galactosidase [Pseudomonadota bacterium]
MGLIRVTDELTFSLANASVTYVFRVTEEDLLEHLYFGPAIADAPDPMSRDLRHCTVMFESSDLLTLNELPQEYPTLGRGDFGSPACQLSRAEISVLDLRYAHHQVLNGKADLRGLPSARGTDAETLIVTVTDAVQQVELDLYYTIWPDSAVIARRAEIRNLGASSFQLRQLASLSFDLPPDQYELLHFHGTWAREFNIERYVLPSAGVSIGSARGTSSNAHPPYMAILEPDATEVSGRCYGTTLLYSGNFETRVERGEFGRVRCVNGINPLDFDWMLEPGERFASPEGLMAVSDAGLGGLSHVWHDFIRSHVAPERFRDQPRPTYLNTWEAAYFDVTEDKVLALADQAAELGIERLVLDDGWFKGRTDDRRALGDWSADPDRFPSGIPALARQVQDKDLCFGIWVEPEMVSPDSDLYRVNPDWAIAVPGREPSLGRNQLTLDLSRPEIVDHIFGWLDALLSSAPIDYVKWDMNRNMTEVGSGAKAHRYMLGLYDLLNRITSAHPNVLFENCASGGNRFDLGMLSYMPQGWISDMCDPVGRLSIINGASHLFPPDVMAAYIGPSPNHQNGRVSSIKARYHAGLPCASHGLSLNIADIEQNRDALQRYVLQSKAFAVDRLGARFDRLRHSHNETIWQMMTADEATVRVMAFRILNAPNLPQRRVRLRGLDPDADYALENGETYAGNLIMHRGLDLTPATEDFASELLVLRKVR